MECADIKKTKPFGSTHSLFPFPNQPLQIGTVAILIANIALLAFLICHNTIYCRRRRVDRAAKREERQTRRAYRSATRSLRWQRCWEGITGTVPVLPSSSTSTQLHEFCGVDFTTYETPHYQAQSEHHHDDPTASEPSGFLQAEIRSFRQDLNYVGGLVRNRTDGDLENATRHVDHEHYGDKFTDLIEKERESSSSGASSITGLSTVMSLRTTSLGTDMDSDILSCGMLETTETPPPSYHP
ncbi:hypothetical protein BDW62DRAFT_201060 [Aspergillus aurantiobrunneus]